MLERLNSFFELVARKGEGGNVDLGEASKTVLDEFFKIGGIVIPVVLAVGAILIIIKLISLGIKLAQSGDDPEQRSKIIKGMIWWGIGLLIMIAAMATSATVLNIFAAKS